MQKLDVLVFSTHPDDAELGCGGTIIRLSGAGKKIGIADLTRGELGTRGSVKQRQKESELACKVMNIKIRHNLNLSDGDIQNTKSNRVKLIKLIRFHKPEIVFLPYPKDRHPDHPNSSTLIRESAFYSGLSKIHTIYKGKAQIAHRPSMLIYYMQTNPFEPSFITDISKEFTKKMEAINCYRTQFYNKKHKGPETFVSDRKFIEYIEARSVFYGFLIGVKYGEPFYTEEKLNLDPMEFFKSSSVK